MNGENLDQLRMLLHPEGGFTSEVITRERREVDRNGFVAALLLRLLRHLPETPVWIDIRESLLDWIWTCRSTKVPGAFAFWPDHTRPQWASAVPADVDDTAIMLTELLRYRRLDRIEVLRSVCTTVVPYVVLDSDATLPPWIVPGSFLTWITPDTSRTRSINVVDCCVNANVVGLMALLDAKHLPGYDAAVHTVLNGIAWAGTDERRLSSITPFYPSVRSLIEAVEHAIECGADGLQTGLAQIMSVAPEILNADAGCCRSAYGQTVWHAPAISVARQIANQLVFQRR